METKVYTGIVEKGEGRAMRLGFPTINIPLPDADVAGIYAAQVKTDGDAYPAAAFADPGRGILEAHLIGFSGDLYGQSVSIALVEKIRDSMHFEDETALSAAIAGDVEKTRAILLSWKRASS